MPVIVRPARPSEYERVGELTVQSYLAAGHLNPDDPYLKVLRDVPARAPKAELLVAVEDEVVVGTVTWCPVGVTFREIGSSEEGEFRWLAVALDRQGRGVGEALVRACLKRCDDLGYRALVLSTGDWMYAAHRLYTRMGMVRVPQRDWSPVPGMTLWTFQLDLAGP